MMTRTELRRMGATVGREALWSAFIGLPTYAAGAENRELVVAFALPFVGWLGVAYNVQTQNVMDMSPKGK